MVFRWPSVLRQRGRELVFLATDSGAMGTIPNQAWTYREDLAAGNERDPVALKVRRAGLDQRRDVPEAEAGGSTS